MKTDKIVSFRDVTLKNGFWQERYFVNKNTSLACVQKRFEETGRFDALRFRYAQTGQTLHVYFDSDVAKWIEAVAYLIEKDREGMRDYEAFVDALIESMARNQMEDGYLNSYFQQMKPENRFTNRDAHELYCAGHLIEAAVAYAKATGKTKFLSVMEKYCDYIDRVFRTERTAPYFTPGHEEIELALFRLYEYTGKEKYLTLSKFFLENRGVNKEQLIYGDNPFGSQDDVSIYDLQEANGHCVRALYFYCGIADLAFAQKDKKLFDNLESVFTDILTNKSYITGGVGSTHRSESFTRAYDLPNPTAYSESCGAIAAILFSLRMRRMNANAKYGHYIERVLYNAFLSSTSVDGRAFFYENPLEIALEEFDREIAVPASERERMPIKERKEVFFCSCCPPNVNRFLASVGDVITVEGEENLFIEQYISADVKTAFGTVTVAEEYATEGTAVISSSDYSAKVLAIRVPEWCKRVSATLNGAEVSVQVQEDGYAYFAVEKSFTLALDFHIAPQFVSANPNVRANVGRVALTYGPLVYCLEGIDNGARLNQISVTPSLAGNIYKEKDFHGLYSIEMDGYRDCAQRKLYFCEEEGDKEAVRLRFIPYFAFANRGESDMLVWVRKN